MSTIWFTADHHFGHANIIKHCNRPFIDADEMDKVLLDNLNKVVQPNDILYHLGDFAFRGRPPGFYREQINCKKIFLILGNHDPRHKNGQPKRELFDIFSGVYSQYTVRIDKRKITLNHYAMAVWDSSHYGSWHLFGHSHGQRQTSTLSMDVGVDCFGFMPVSYEQIRDEFKKKEHLIKVDNDELRKYNIVN